MVDDPGLPPVLTGNRAAIEAALRQQLLWMGLSNGRWWRCHRYGRIGSENRNMVKFSIPIIVGSGLITKTSITHESRVMYVWERYAHTAQFVWCDGNPLVHIGLSRP
jgi:hypothetical protein